MLGKHFKFFQSFMQCQETPRWPRRRSCIYPDSSKNQTSNPPPKDLPSGISWANPSSSLICLILYIISLNLTSDIWLSLYFGLKTGCRHFWHDTYKCIDMLVEWFFFFLLQTYCFSSQNDLIILRYYHWTKKIEEGATIISSQSELFLNLL